MVVAPLSANTLAKIAGGLCDNLLVRDNTTTLAHVAHMHAVLNGV